jgi:hypothetical protein
LLSFYLLGLPLPKRNNIITCMMPLRIFLKDP